MDLRLKGWGSGDGEAGVLLHSECRGGSGELRVGRGSRRKAKEN